MRRSPVILFAVASFACTACFGRGGGLLFAVLGTAIVTAAVVSASEPPPPRVVYIPDPRPGYAWEAGYWTLQDSEWVWVDGKWVALPPGYAWSATHWEHDPNGSWRLIPGQWVPAPSSPLLPRPPPP
jgi:hypothetical protein